MRVSRNDGDGNGVGWPMSYMKTEESRVAVGHRWYCLLFTSWVRWKEPSMWQEVETELELQYQTKRTITLNK